MSGVGLVDVLLAMAVPALAAAALLYRDLFRATVVFLVLGLTIALVWVRLDAPDIALAEAAVGAGITGALFMRALGALPGPPRRNAPAHGAPVFWLAVRGSAGALAAVVALLLAWAVSTVPSGEPVLARLVRDAAPESGVGNPVTAVLLNFRGYDTLLEVGVLLLAALGVSTVGADRHAASLGGARVRGPVTLAFAHFMLPGLAVVAAYLLWIGADQPGGAFQGAAVLAGAWLLSAFAGVPADIPPGRMPVILAGGFFLFLLVAAGMVALNGALLCFTPATAKWWMLLIESGLLVSCAAILATLVFRLTDDERPEAGR
ncbi:MAG: hydrogen gas-evolving membrane-bound hydrogenase subunit E [Rhodospirillaceae bacterium]